jgi:FkbM family methyltransferase
MTFWRMVDYDLRRRVRAARISRRLRYWRWKSAQRAGFLDASIGSGTRMRLYMDSALSQLIYFWDLEADERRFLHAFLRPGDVFVDVGANVGLYTLAGAQLVATHGEVHAFEPSGRAFERLCENIRLNRYTNVTTHRTALGDTEGDLVMKASQDGHDAWNSYAKPSMGSFFNPEVTQCARWDTFASQHDLIGRVALMKIDVEGWEERVLIGGQWVFARADAPVLQVEFTDATIRAAGSSCAAVYGRLVALGYRLFRYHPRQGLVPEALRVAYPYDNLFAIKDLELVRHRLRHGIAR